MPRRRATKQLHGSGTGFVSGVTGSGAFEK